MPKPGAPGLAPFETWAPAKPRCDRRTYTAANSIQKTRKRFWVAKPGAPGLAPFETLNSHRAPDSKQLIPLRLIQGTGTAVTHTLLVFRDIIRVGDSDACSKRISLGFVVA